MALPTEFLVHAQDVIWHSGAQISAWYGAIGGQSSYVPASDDAAGNIATRIGEFNVELVEANRQLWIPDESPPTTPVSTNAAVRMQFTANAIIDIWAFTFNSCSSKQCATGILCATFKLGALRHLEVTDELQVKVTITTSDAS